MIWELRHEHKITLLLDIAKLPRSTYYYYIKFVKDEDKHRKDELLKGAPLYIETIEAVTFCTACESTYETVRYGKTCPRCGSGETYLLRGSEISIKQIEAETYDES